jgi:hypothetical protein
MTQPDEVIVVTDQERAAADDPPDDLENLKDDADARFEGQFKDDIDGSQVQTVREEPWRFGPPRTPDLPNKLIYLGPEFGHASVIREKLATVTELKIHGWGGDEYSVFIDGNEGGGPGLWRHTSDKLPRVECLKLLLRTLALFVENGLITAVSMDGLETVLETDANAAPHPGKA